MTLLTILKPGCYANLSQASHRADRAQFMSNDVEGKHR